MIQARADLEPFEVVDDPAARVGRRGVDRRSTGTPGALVKDAGYEPNGKVNINPREVSACHMLLIRRSDATLFVSGADDPTAQRIRLAFSIETHVTRVCSPTAELFKPKPITLRSCCVFSWGACQLEIEIRLKAASCVLQHVPMR